MSIQKGQSARRPSQQTKNGLFSLQTSISIAFARENFMNRLATLRSSSYSRG